VVRKPSSPACLTGIMILVFLGVGGARLIIAISIPLSILTSVICSVFSGKQSI